MDSLSPHIERVARTPKLLIACDFDGTIAGLSEDPFNVPVNTQTLGALYRLGGMPNTRATILSGRDLAQLARVVDVHPPIRRTGSHGAEPDDATVGPNDDDKTTLALIAEDLERLCEGIEGAFVEYKPFQVTLHYIRVKDDDVRNHLLAQAEQVDARGTHVSHGKRIIEYSVTEITKGTWITDERERFGATAVMSLGDDVTDENGFKVLNGDDLGVHVGDGETAATVSVPDRDGVAEVLTSLAKKRAHHLGVPEDFAGGFQMLSATMSSIVVQITDWESDTPCARWLARDIINHLVTWFPMRLSADGYDLHLTGDALTDPVDAWFEFTTALQGLIDDDALPKDLTELGRTRLLPDIFIHTWDLAVAGCMEVELDENYATQVRHGAVEHVEALRASGAIDKEVDVPEDAGEVTRLLGFFGRKAR